MSGQNVGNLESKLILDTDQFDRNLKKAEKSAVSAGSRIAAAFGSNAVSGVNKMYSALDRLSFKADGVGKDVSRIAQGIIFSQAFYRSVNAISSAVGGIFNLAKESEVAAGSFAVLLQNEEHALALVEHLKAFAAETNFTFATASDAARQLLAYGFQLKELDTVMTTIGDATAAMGDTQAFGRIARALGQIRTRGKLATQEILQLTEAGIPAYEILADKLQLTNEQLANIGHLGINSDVAIDALLSGIQERFGGSMALMADTVDGYLNNIVESFNATAVEITKPFYAAFKNILRAASELMSEIWSIARSSGAGGIINHFFSFKDTEIIRQLVGAFKILGASIANLFASLKPLFAEFTRIASTIGGVLIPALSLFLNFLSALAQLVASNTVLMKAFTIAVTALLVIKSVVLVVRALATAFALLASPVGLVIAGITALAAAFAYFTGRGSQVVSVINGIGQALNNLYKVKNEDILPPQLNDPPSLDGILGDLEDTGDAVEDLGDEIEDAGKKAKRANNGLQSFDEVFNLMENASSSGDNEITLPEFEFPDYGVGESPFAGFGFGFDTSGLESSMVDVQSIVDKMMSKVTDTATTLKDKIAPMMQNAFKFMFSDTNMDTSLFGSLTEFANTVVTVFTRDIIPMASHFTEKFIKPVASGFVDYLLPTTRDMLNGVIQISSNLLDNLGQVASSVYNVFAPVIELFGNILNGLMEGLYNAWANEGQNTVDALNSFVDSCSRIFQKLMDDILGPIIKPFCEGFQRVWDESLKDCMQEAVEFLLKLVQWASEIWTLVFEPVINYIIDEFKPLFESVFTVLADVLSGFLLGASEVLRGLMKVFEGVIEFLLGVFTGDWERALGGLHTGVDGVFQVVEGAWKGILDIMDGVLQWIGTFFGPEWERFCNLIRDILAGAGESMLKVIEGIKEMLHGVLEFVSGIFTGDWEQVWEGCKKIFSGFGEALGGTLDFIFGLFENIISYLATSFINQWKPVWDTCVSIFEGFKENIQKGIEWITDKWDTFIGWLSSIVQPLWEGFLNAAGNKMTEWKDDMQKALSFVEQKWNDFTTWLSGICSKAFNSFIEGIQERVSKWKESLSEKLKLAQDAFDRLIGWLKSTFSVVWESIITKLETVIKNVMSGIGKQLDAIKQVFSGLSTFLSGAFSGDWKKAIQGLVDIFAGIWKGLETIIKAPLNFMIDMINKVIKGINTIPNTLNKIPGIEMPTIPNVPKLATGGVVQRHTLAEIGEGNKREAIIPLENGTAIDMIASRIMQNVNTQQPKGRSVETPTYYQPETQSQTPNQIMYVGTLIADDRSLRELERKMSVIRLQESARRG